ncbi:MAG: response regulator transcription factor [Ferruginibacter sp.]|nr:response regulator transcription factor [Ferruginibacter sp.]
MHISNNNGLITLAVADDHNLFREAICSQINSWDNCKVIVQAANGKQLLERLHSNNLPNVALIDINMPELNGYQTIKAITEKYPSIKLMAISCYDSAEMVCRLIKFGARGFVNKNDDTNRLKKAITQIVHTGYFFSDHTASKMVEKAIRTGTHINKDDVGDKEIIFLKLLCTDKTYKEIANEMDITERHTEHIRNTLFEKFSCKSRTGLAVKATEKGLVV